MSDPIKRLETTHMNEITRIGFGTTQWFAENLNLHGSATHPITHNNKLTLFVCGEEGFADIAEQIGQAKYSIDLCCWGFDPGMELQRGYQDTWPRGETFGDKLIAAARRGVTVRLLVWFDNVGVHFSPNITGYRPWEPSFSNGMNSTKAEKISARNSLLMFQEAWNVQQLQILTNVHLPWSVPGDFKEKQIPLLAREHYCHSWYAAACNGLLPGISVRTRHGNTAAIQKNLQTEKNQPASMSQLEFESAGMTHFGTHHQKPILIDYIYQQGCKAVGYVMGLNALTDYWDTAEHHIDDPRREQGGRNEQQEVVQGKEAEPGFRSLKPYQDYACRIDGGKALSALYKNFVSAWDRAAGDATEAAGSACETTTYRWGKVYKGQMGQMDSSLYPHAALLRKAEPGDSTVQIVRTQPEEQDKSIRDIYFQATDIATLAGGYLYVEKMGQMGSSLYSQCHDAPAALLRKAEPGDSTVQIVRTQPEEQDKSIRDIYFQATDIATLAGGYLYVENQYFQYEEWTQRLMEKRAAVMAAWNLGRVKHGKVMEEMPVMHVFIVTPVPERKQMIPRTYDALAHLGQSGAMTGQSKLIKDYNEHPKQLVAMTDELGNPTYVDGDMPEFVRHANAINKPDSLMLESTFGMKVSVAMLQTCGIINGRWRYREIYVHSKLLLVNDDFFTLGSANLNQRSMAVDSEMNLATNDRKHARALRKRIWMQHSGNTICGGGGTKAEIKIAFGKWVKLMNENKTKTIEYSEDAIKKKMTGFLVPLEDKRISTMRLG